MLDFTYIPKRLIQANSEIKIQHPLESSVPPQVQPSNELMALITRLANLELYQVKMNAMALTKEELHSVVAYLPFNYYNVEMHNLFLVFQFRSNKKLCEILYDQWQDSYENADCNKYILSELLVKDEQFIMLIRGNNITEETYASYLRDGNIATKYGLALRNYSFSSGMNLKDKLAYFGVRSDSRLYRDCEFLFYTFCEREDYLLADKQALLVLLNKYTENQLKQFLKNFLSKLSVKELEQFPAIASFLIKQTGEPQTQQFTSFFVDFSYELIRKYTDWINVYKVNQYFGYDERSMFWKKYRFVDVKKYNYSDSVVMEFDRFVAVEFLGQAMGPIYIYNKDYFNSHVRQWFVNRSYDNNEMRHRLLHYTDYNGHGYRKEHRGYWQGDVHSILIYNHITEVLKD